MARYNAVAANNHMASYIGGLIEGLRVALLLFTFLLTTLGRMAQEILLQYVTNRYGWSWAQVRWLPFFEFIVAC
jgi:hypothetical protein